MKIMIEMGLGDSLVVSLVQPLTQVPEVQEVLIVRNQSGPSLPKVRYYCPPRFSLRFPPFAACFKLLILIWVAFSRKPDFIHSNILFPHGIMAFIVGKLFGKPVSVTLNSGEYEFFQMGDSRLGVSYEEPIPWFGMILLWLVKHCDNVMVINSSTRKFLISHGTEAEKIHILPQPADKEKLYPGQTHKKYDILSLGRLAPSKHVEVLLGTVAIVKNKLPYIRVGIVGDGPSRESLEKTAKKLGVDSNVAFLGFRKNTAYYYKASKLFVLNSERESGPVTFTEAMMCGLPSIVSNCGIIADIGRNGVNCIIINKYNDTNAYADAILHLLEDKKYYLRISKNALQTSRDISVESAIEVWEKAIEQFLK